MKLLKGLQTPQTALPLSYSYLELVVECVARCEAAGSSQRTETAARSRHPAERDRSIRPA